MSAKTIKEPLQTVEYFIENGNFKEASNILKTIDPSQLYEEEKKRYNNFKSILTPDKIYILVSIGVILMAIIYFVLVK
jgi:hypothetical protein